MSIWTKCATAAMLALLLLLGGCDRTEPTPQPEPSTPSEPTEDQPSENEPAQAWIDRYDVLMRGLRETEGAPLVAERKEALRFSLDTIGSAFFNSTRTLVISADRTDATIYYTTDGSEPTPENGYRYVSPFTLYAEELPRAYHYAARAVYADGSMSEVSYRTYFVGTGIVEQFNMLVFYVDAEESDLWSAETGIFHTNNIQKSGRDWERPMNVQLFDSDGTELFNMPAGIRIYGGYSRAHALKSMRYIARKDYDAVYDDFNVLDLFGPLYTAEGVRIDKFEHLVIRNTGNDFGQAFMKDEIVQMLMREQGFAFTEPVRPCLVYVNGTLYGMYWMHEPYKSCYFESRFEQYDYKGDFVVLDGPERQKLATGDEHVGYDPLKDYNEMLDFASYDLCDDEVYAALCERLDVESYLHMHAAMAYVNNGDWPQNNNRAFKYFAAPGEARSDVYGMDGKWYFLPHDTDWALGDATADTLGRCYDEKAIQYSPLFCALMKRDDCRVTYVTYVLDMINGAFAPERSVPIVQQTIETVRPGLELYLQLSPYLPDNFDMAAFDRRSARIATFLEQRPSYMIKHMQPRYVLGQPYTLTVEVGKGGGAKVNSYVCNGDFTGTYYTYYPTTVQAIVPVGYEFDHWLVNGVRRNGETLTVEDVFAYTGAVHVQAVLRRVEGLRLSAVGYDGENDYVVLTNFGADDVSTEGYYLSDDERAPWRYALPTVTVAAGQSIVVYGEDYGRRMEGNVMMSFRLAKGETLCLSRVQSGVGRAVDRLWLPPKMQDTSSYERDLSSGAFYEVLAGER